MRIGALLGVGSLVVVVLTALPGTAHADARVTLSPAAGPAGTSVVLRGHGFGGSRALVVRRGRTRLARARSGRRGSFRVRVTIPSRAKGTVRLATRSRSRRVVNRFRVSSAPAAGATSERATSKGLRLRWSPSEGPAGASVRLRGAGFKPRRGVRASFVGAAARRTRSDRRGGFAIGLVAPGAPLAASERRRTAVRVRSGRTRLRFGFVVTGSAAPGPGPQPEPPGPGPADSQPAFPIRGAFYYPWYPETSWSSPDRLHTRYHPSPGWYNSSSPALMRSHLRALDYAKVEVGISSWWGRGHRTDNRLAAMAAETSALGSPVRWSLYYEPEGEGDPSVAQIRSDLAYLRDRYGSDPAYFRVGGRFVVFVWAPGDDCSMAERWKQANTVGAYVVLKLFSGSRDCPNQPDGWHQYSSSPETSHPPHSFTVSPGFWKWDQPAPKSPRDLGRFRQNVRHMVASGARFQLLISFNEWGEGTAAESAQEWPSPSGYGDYLDALHNDGS